MSRDLRTERSRKGARGYKGPPWLARLLNDEKWQD